MSGFGGEGGLAFRVSGLVPLPQVVALVNSESRAGASVLVVYYFYLVVWTCSEYYCAAAAVCTRTCDCRVQKYCLDGRA